LSCASWWSVVAGALAASVQVALVYRTGAVARAAESRDGVDLAERATALPQRN
jgi:hypothetical protein